MDGSMTSDFKRTTTPLPYTHNYGESRDGSLQPFLIDGDDEYQSYGGGVDSQEISAVKLLAFLITLEIKVLIS